MKLKIDSETELVLVKRDFSKQFFSVIDNCRPYLRDWLGWVDATKTVADLEKFIDVCNKEFEAQKGLSAWIWYENRIVGVMHLKEVDRTNRKAMIGYWVAQNHRGKGFAKNACRTMINFAFNQWNLNRIEIRCATGNFASQSIPIKLNFRREGILRENEWLYDHFVDHVVFSMLKKDWFQ